MFIVDDSPTEIFKISQILNKRGYEVLTADSGEKGIELAKQEMPDVVLMDIVMPGLNGFQATRQLSRDPETSGIPVIIVTTKDQETDRLWGQRQGAKGYLTKPVDSKGLLKAIDAVLN
ncbi:twitching motility response regulator PilH [Zhongshania aliphaticivorans]|uniref:twitching motility response regulator PilH n=1 Tax=Zhongshania aliphaticivorans TaxID=1470434 RepID=UPI0039C98C01